MRGRVCSSGKVLSNIYCFFSLSTQKCVHLGSDRDDCSERINFQIAPSETRELTTETLVWKRSVRQISTPKKVFHVTNPRKVVRSISSDQSQKVREKMNADCRIKTILGRQGVKPDANISNHDFSRWIADRTMTQTLKKLRAEYNETEDIQEQDENYNN